MPCPILGFSKDDFQMFKKCPCKKLKNIVILLAMLYFLGLIPEGKFKHVLLLIAGNELLIR